MEEKLFLRRFELFGSDLELVPGEVEVIRAVDGDQMQVGMRHFEAYHGDATAITGKGFLDGFGDGPREYQQLAQVGFWQVKEFVDLDPGHDEGMSFTKGKDIQEGEESLVFGYLIRGYPASDDL
jgi:hypothetical protein